MKLVVTVDVEEEGLFSGRYSSDHITAENVFSLAKLDPIFRDHGIRPTMLVTYQVAKDPRSRDFLADLSGRWRGEIGAHLHHWNTPPLEPSPHSDPVPSELISYQLLASKFDTLLDAVRRIDGEPTSFRMGRFNMGPKMFSVLERSSISVDSSISPMRTEYGGPTHLSAPVDPYFPDPQNPQGRGTARILEVPITTVPVIPNLGSHIEMMADNRISRQAWAQWFALHLGSISAQPIFVGLRRIKTAVRLHRSRGGRVVTIFFHSSELMPGGSPRHKAEHDVNRFLTRLAKFFEWLRTVSPHESVTLAELRRSLGN